MEGIAEAERTNVTHDGRCKRDVKTNRIWPSLR